MLLISGTQEAILLEARLIDIHGTRFYDLLFTLNQAPEQRQSARIGTESVYTNPRPGDTIRVRYLMGVVTSVEQR